MAFLDCLQNIPDLQCASNGTFACLQPGEQHLLLVSGRQIQQGVLLSGDTDCYFECSYKSLGNASYVTTHLFALEGIRKTFFERKTQPDNFHPWVSRSRVGRFFQVIHDKIEEMKKEPY